MPKRIVNNDHDTPLLLPPDLCDWLPKDQLVHLAASTSAIQDAMTVQEERRPLKFPTTPKIQARQAARSKTSAQRLAHAFSLVEMLIVIAVIGVIAAIAIPNIGDINNAAKISAAQRRAQDIALIFNSGVAAGAPSFMAAQTVGQAQDAVGIGDNGGDTLSRVHLQISGVSANQDAALPDELRTSYYLVWNNGFLLFDKAGGH